MRVAISGSAGFIGSAIVSRLKQAGFSITPIVRPGTKSFSQMAIHWDPTKEAIDAQALEGYDCIIHLGGVSIAGHRWDKNYKKLIFESRVKSTELLSRVIAKLSNPPKLFLTASAVGFYGSYEPQHIFDETSPKGAGFLAEVCEQWEKATKSAESAGIRVVQARFGMVLGKGGGALSKMLPIFKSGLGGPLGDGRQAMSWIALPEIPDIILELIQNLSLRGPINVVSPEVVSNAEFTRVLGQVLHRPVVLPAPAFAIKLAFGEMGETLLLEGANISPRRLIKAGYKFRYPNLKAALEAAIL